MKSEMLRSRGDFLLKKYDPFIQPVDVFTARLLAGKSRLEHEQIFDLAIILCVAIRNSQVSLSRGTLDGKSLPELLELLVPDLKRQANGLYPANDHASSDTSGDGSASSKFGTPEFKEITIDQLLDSGLIIQLSSGIEPEAPDLIHAPIVLQGEWMYFRRQWVSEWYILRVLQSRLREQLLIDDLNYYAFVETLFYDSSGLATGQISAVQTANKYSFSIITGGPGTGKTRTIVGFMASVLKFNPELRIQLCAPTGKAASRMVESIQKAIDSDAKLKEFESVIPQQSSTIHRILGWNPSTGSFRHHEGNPIKADVIIVDEASMIDLVMFSRLMRAVSSDCRIILLGDKDQLASVEAGSVFGDIIRAGLNEKHSLLSRVITRLTHSWRFKSDSGIGLLAELINSGQFDKSWDALQFTTDSIRLVNPDYSTEMLNRFSQIHTEICPMVSFEGPLSEYYNEISKNASLALKTLGDFQVLTAHRTGKLGAVHINRYIDQHVGKDMKHGWYTGRPVIATENDYENSIFNGDIGITVRVGSEYWVFFGTDESTGQLRLFKPSQLTQIESSWALTVHKSQGSEYKEILLLMPDYESPVASRELVYTAVTRTKEKLAIVVNRSVWKYALTTTLYREGGFVSRLLSATNHQS